MSNKYFVYDPENGFETFATKEECEKEANELIRNYLQDAWDEACENVVSGTITHKTTQIDREERPDKLDEEGCDEGGQYWGDVEYRCDYKLKPVTD